MIDRSTLKDLEFDKVLQEISNRSRSSVGRNAVLNIVPFECREDIAQRREEIEALRILSAQDEALSLSRFEDISSALVRVRPAGAILEADDFIDIRSLLTVIKEVASQLLIWPDLTQLARISSSLTGFPDLLKLLDRTFDREGNVVDGASAKLSKLRKGLRGLSARVGKRLDELIKDENVAPFLQDDFVTKRGERWVIPVRMDSKGQVSGVVHDVSNTGETAFVEPTQIVGLVNELENLTADEKAEVIRIKRSICDEIRDVAPDLESQFYVIVHIDLINAIAEYADRFGMNAATIGDSQVISLKGAAHPLLVAQQREGTIENVVPLDFTLEGEKRVMVITGPNAGGKTITIKTAGLLVLMALSGIPVSADSSSIFPLAAKLLVDIGDEQSIESSMSTFSSHLSRISKIISEADEKSIILLDEVGTGTEPLQGAAIACSVLNELKNKGAIVFATTHLTDIVAFVRKSGGMMNASMEFDRVSHTPLYKLKEGEPGQSHAIDAAKRYGLPDTVIRFAREMMGGMNAEMQELISELKEKSAHYDEAKEGIELRAKEFALKEAELEAKLIDVREKAQSAYMEAYRESRDMIVAAKREIRDIIEEGKKEGNKAALKKLEKKRLGIVKKIDEHSGVAVLSFDNIAEGDMVFVRSLDKDAKVISLDRRRMRLGVKSKGISFDVPLADIMKESGKTGKGSKKQYKVTMTFDDAAGSIKLLGMRLEEALKNVESFIDGAVVSGLNEVKIIHGVGTGVLMTGIRAYLKTHPDVASHRSGEQSEGGAGVTIVTLR